MRILLKTYGTIIIVFSLGLIFWYFVLIKIPDTLVMGAAAPAMTKEEALDLMRYHGVKVAYTRDGQWVFDRNGTICRLSKKK